MIIFLLKEWTITLSKVHISKFCLHKFKIYISSTCFVIESRGCGTSSRIEQKQVIDGFTSTGRARYERRHSISWQVASKSDLLVADLDTPYDCWMTNNLLPFIYIQGPLLGSALLLKLRTPITESGMTNAGHRFQCIYLLRCLAGTGHRSSDHAVLEAQKMLFSSL